MSSTEDDLVGRLNSTVARINDKVMELQSTINDKLHWLPGFIADHVVSAWNRFVELMDQVWDATSQIFGNLGSPSTLWDTADAWSNTVGGSVSGQEESADAGYLEVDDHWDGDGADRYRQRLPAQKTALDKIKTVYSDGISSALSDVAKGIIAFWGSLIVALGSLVTGIIGAIASSATIVGLPAGPFIAAGAAAAAILAFASGGMILKSVASSANTTLRQKINDNTAFRDPDGTVGHWPATTA